MTSQRYIYIDMVMIILHHLRMLHPLCTYPDESVHALPLVHHVPTINASISGHVSIPSTPHVYFSVTCSTAWNSVLPHVEFRSTRASLSAGAPATQVHINMYITCQVPCVHLMHLLPQHPMLQASL